MNDKNNGDIVKLKEEIKNKISVYATFTRDEDFIEIVAELNNMANGSNREVAIELLKEAGVKL